MAMSDAERRRFLERVHDVADGRVDRAVRIEQIGQDIGLSRADAMSIASYWWQRKCTRPGGGLLMADGIRLTADGVDLVEHWRQRDRLEVELSAALDALTSRNDKSSIERELEHVATEVRDGLARQESDEVLRPKAHRLRKVLGQILTGAVGSATATAAWGPIAELIDKLF